MLKINGLIIDPSDSVIGPRGMEQINLRQLDIDSGDCNKKGKDVKVSLKQKICIDCKIEVIVLEKEKNIKYGCPVKVAFF